MKKKKFLDILAMISLGFLGIYLFLKGILSFMDLDASQSISYNISYIMDSIIPLAAIVYVFVWAVLKIKKK